MRAEVKGVIEALREARPDQRILQTVIEDDVARSGLLRAGKLRERRAGAGDGQTGYEEAEKGAHERSRHEGEETCRATGE